MYAPRVELFEFGRVFFVFIFAVFVLFVFADGFRFVIKLLDKSFDCTYDCKCSCVENSINYYCNKNAAAAFHYIGGCCVEEKYPHTEKNGKMKRYSKPNL